MLSSPVLCSSSLKVRPGRSTDADPEISAQKDPRSSRNDHGPRGVRRAFLWTFLRGTPADVECRNHSFVQRLASGEQHS